jgi:hypothetical protein
MIVLTTGLGQEFIDFASGDFHSDAGGRWRSVGVGLVPTLRFREWWRGESVSNSEFRIQNSEFRIPLPLWLLNQRLALFGQVQLFFKAADYVVGFEKMHRVDVGPL